MTIEKSWGHRFFLSYHHITMTMCPCTMSDFQFANYPVFAAKAAKPVEPVTVHFYPHPITPVLQYKSRKCCT